jgi:hypothetical protein
MSQKEKLIPAMAIDDIAAWLDEEITYLTRLVENKGEGVKAVVQFTIEHLTTMKENLLQSAKDGAKT